MENGFCKQHSGFEQRLKSREEDDEKQWEAIERLRNRLPVWATVVISVLTFLLGGALTFAGLASKIINIQS